MRSFTFHPTIKAFPLLIVLFLFFNNNIFANIDTIYAGIPQGQFGVSCIDLSGFSGTIQSTTNICPNQSGTNATINIQPGNPGCISYFGINEGSSTACIEICDDSPSCDTFYILLNVAPITPLNTICDSLIIPEVINHGHNDCDVAAKICLPIRFDMLTDIEIYDNGVLYNNGLTGCNIDTIIAYSYFALFGQGAIGPYFLDSWSINGTEYSGDFADINALVDSMNVWDTLGAWSLDTLTPFTIRGGFSDNFYSSLIASKPGVINSTSIMGANYGLTPLGSEIELLTGQHLIELVDTINACTDSVIVNVVCMPDVNLMVRTYVGLSNSICIDTSMFVGVFDSIENTCSDDIANSEIGIDIFSNDNCLDWEALEVGDAQACIVACDSLGFCYNTFINFEILPLTPDTINFPMLENDFDTICIDTTELFGNLTSFDLVCPNNGLTSIELDTINYCIHISSALPGNDSLCVVLCDDEGGCDTTYINIIVSGEITAVTDNGSTEQNESDTIDVLANDIFSVLDTIYILTPPPNGTVEWNTDGLMTYIYTPNQDYCGQDEFTYEICNANGCSSTNVIIDIACDEVYVYNGFSPNGDGINDAFRVDGLEGYPDHIVNVYNRWGNLIMEETEYKSSWQGTWNGIRLPEGTYYYLIQLNDDKGTIKAGYVYMTH